MAGVKGLVLKSDETWGCLGRFLANLGRPAPPRHPRWRRPWAIACAVSCRLAPVCPVTHHSLCLLPCRAVPCSAMPCRATPCYAMPCCADHAVPNGLVSAVSAASCSILSCRELPRDAVLFPALQQVCPLMSFTTRHTDLLRGAASAGRREQS